MNKYIASLFIGTSMIAGFTSCEDYLDREPEANLVAENYFTDGANLSAYVMRFYDGMLPSHSSNAYGMGTFANDNGTDNQVARSIPSRYANGQWLTSNDESNWSFGNIRSLNLFFEYVLPNIESGKLGLTDMVRQSIGEAYFFRAYQYYASYSTIGDYPIIDNVLPDDKELLLENSYRRPRNQVARHILEDLDNALAYLPESSDKGKQGVNRDCALLLRSRVALFEGTWLKYHKGTALVPGGPGWPGDAALLGSFDIDAEINYFLTEAMTSAKELGDKMMGQLAENTGVIDAFSPSLAPLNPYFCMFGQQDLDSYSEVLMYRAYQLTAPAVSTQIQHSFMTHGGGLGYTRGMIRSFVMANGLPIYADGSGFDPDWESAGVTATLQDRDSRAQLFVRGDNCLTSYKNGEEASTYNMSWLLTESATQNPITGYANKKGCSFDYSMAEGNSRATTGSITFRGVEALLNYMEACVEKNGNVDQTADSYWKAIRTRAKVDPDYTKTIAATNMTIEGEGDWGAYSRGALVNTLLYNVRRERRNELMAEGFRYNDLRRWCALDQLAANPVNLYGMKYWNTVYSDPQSDLALTTTDEDGNEVFLAARVNPDGDGNMSSQAEGDWIVLNRVTKNDNYVWNGLTWSRAQYLSPIGCDVFVTSSPDGDKAKSVVYQNPGWPTTGLQPCTKID